MDDVNKRLDVLESTVENLANKLNLFLKSYSENLEREVLEDKEKEEIRPHYEEDWSIPLSSGELHGTVTLDHGNFNNFSEGYLDTSIKIPEVKINKLLLLDLYLKTVDKLLE